MNLHQYCFNNPYRYQDPTGEHAALLGLTFKWGTVAGLTFSGPTGWFILGGLVTGAGLAYGCHLYNQYDLRQQRIEAYQLDKDEGYIDDAYSDVLEKRSKHCDPDTKAEGRPHTVIEKPGQRGQYTTFNEDGSTKQYRGSGKAHGTIERPNIKEIDVKQTPNGSRHQPPKYRTPENHEIPG